MKKKDMNKQAKIQDAVAAIILAEGPAGVSTTKVAKRVGIAQSNVYLYFKNKQALIDSVYARETTRILSTTDIARLSDATIDLSTRIRLYVQQVYDYSLAHPDSLTIMQQIKALNGQPMTVLPGVADPNNIVVKLLTAAVDAQVIKPLPVSLHMGVVFSTIHTHTTNISQGRYSATQYSFDAIFQLIWDAMKRD
ncbi:TetR/AcrR family transcriptional regulator [Lactiplantibacillus pentosus]|jgi:AcrR family transcriptional regulator|uniref:TetR/AcrR family transcriptional regulator n=2 Tax=Lactiplantibacillus pentosus TaxID=1589 RepID=A0AAP9AQN5_LACPE|nr:TetR/AcrR family transcriptional regulator [Lactiplantibacillus pentosus]CCC17586.1 putative transcription regulator [Lactiplantibacillus pentosus IG1]ASG80339.1 TetR family transcriptional regulator [Lactiplantibacillus pentosus]MBO9164919.1 TetR/AcrR family transcriptional regulator [Lactiplantibacillus pentosus]MBU7474186.1 TetR/AcrR family transcriptional regulator [Lactiplantibacillus pentosus]MBU7503229.1 TetR/AcrR family transcriptional regulator [Lactiplantibacillus pentosus]